MTTREDHSLDQGLEPEDERVTEGHATIGWLQREVDRLSENLPPMQLVDELEGEMQWCRDNLEVVAALVAEAPDNVGLDMAHRRVRLSLERYLLRLQRRSEGY